MCMPLCARAPLLFVVKDPEEAAAHALHHDILIKPQGQDVNLPLGRTPWGRIRAGCFEHFLQTRPGSDSPTACHDVRPHRGGLMVGGRAPYLRAGDPHEWLRPGGISNIYKA